MKFPCAFIHLHSGIGTYLYQINIKNSALDYAFANLKTLYEDCAFAPLRENFRGII